MKFTKLLKSRKSIRTYTGKPADKKQVKKIIEGVNDPFFGCALDTCNSTCFMTPTETVGIARTAGCGAH